MVRATTPATPSASVSAPASAPASSSASSPAAGARRERKACSPKQVAANRANAQKSTGPRTDAGRSASRMNALKHGLRSRAVLLPGESAAEFDAFARPILRDLRPKGYVQEMLAVRVAALAWAIERLPRVAESLVEIGEHVRFGRWFRGRGLHVTHHHERLRELRGEIPHKTRKELDEIVEMDLFNAAVQGDPPPDELDAVGVAADTLQQNTAFDALLRLEEQERRMWAAMLSTIRALERRQKADGCAEEDLEEEEASAKTPAPNEPISDEPPAPLAEGPPDAQVPPQDDDGAAAPSAAPRADAQPADVSPAPNEPICDPPVRAPAAFGTQRPVSLAPPGPDGAG